MNEALGAAEGDLLLLVADRPEAAANGPRRAAPVASPSASA